MSTLCPSGGGLRLPPFPRGRSARRWGPLLLGLPAPARRFKKAATVRSSWPWPLSAAPALGGSRRLTLPPPSCSVRDRPGGGLDAAGLLGTQSAALRASHPGSTAACCPACTTLLALPPPQSPEPCPALVFTWTLILAYSVFTVAGHGWGRIPLSSRSAWMMVLKHNMQSNVLICALEFLLLKKKKKTGSKQSPAPQSVYLDVTDVLGWEACTVTSSEKNIGL